MRRLPNCPQHALTMLNNPAFLLLGNEYWKPQMVATLWGQAENGRIPVSGAGYRGPFAGAGFDEIWTDMSEIVRPTRGGIHGREYISTTVEIGSKPSWIKYFSALPECAFQEIPVPVLFDANPVGLNSNSITYLIVKAAHELGTLAAIDIERCDEKLLPFFQSLVLRITLTAIEAIDEHFLRHGRVVELTISGMLSIEAIIPAIGAIKRNNKCAVIILPLRDSSVAGETLHELMQAGVDVFK